MEFLMTKNPKERLTRTKEEGRVIGFHDLVSAGFVSGSPISTDLIWYQLSWFNGPEASGKIVFCFWSVLSQVSQHACGF